jgi:hypothetical protein
VLTIEDVLLSMVQAFKRTLVGSKVADRTGGPKGGHRGVALLEHFHKHPVGVVLQL